MYYSQRSCPSGTTAYTIRAGDTFYRLSITYNVSLDAMLAANPGVDPDRLSIGQIVCIPVGTTPPPTVQCPTLRIGSRGASVQQLQQLLRNEGYDPGPIDGIFGSRTQSAVIPSRGYAYCRRRNSRYTDMDRTRCRLQTPPPHTPANKLYTIRPGDTFIFL